MKTFTYSMKSGITRSKEFEKKKLAGFAVNVGVSCAHDCTYCSSCVSLRCHRAFSYFGLNPMAPGHSIIDPDIAERVAKDAKRLRRRGMVQLCTTVDAWAPDAHDLRLGRKCLGAILSEPEWTVRILTKNAHVTQDFDVLERYRKRVLLGLSLTGPRESEDLLRIIEPHASPISERMGALSLAAKRKFHTYGMLCPLLPGVSDAPGQTDELVAFVKSCNVKEVFAEPINARGNGLKRTSEELRKAGFGEAAAKVDTIRKRKNWSPYVVRLLRNLQQSMERHMCTGQLRFLLYSKGLQDADLQKIKKNDAGVVWL